MLEPVYGRMNEGLDFGAYKEEPHLYFGGGRRRDGDQCWLKKGGKGSFGELHVMSSNIYNK